MNSNVSGFGANVTPGVGTDFNIWATSAESVTLRIESGGAAGDYPMKKLAQGWYRRQIENAAHGNLYRFLINGETPVPDPSSRYQPEGVDGPSMIVDPDRFEWRTKDWNGRPWEEAVIYELHVGAFSPGGTFDGVANKLDYLRDLGITAIELMPIAQFDGARNWGYDGVLPFAPCNLYGEPDDLRTMIDAAHSRGIMVLLDVVYNHFGPEGNHLYSYAPRFFNKHRNTPWGSSINFDGRQSRAVRDFFIQNALYWLDEFRFDGLRLDAVHAIYDGSKPCFLEELADAVSKGPGAERHVHLILENDNNEAHYLSKGYRAQWNDDIHHALHVTLTNETGGWYADHSDKPVDRIGRCLTLGFDYQGEMSIVRGRPRGEPSGDLPLTSFISYLQSHDMVGNRPFGERIGRLASEEAVKTAASIVMLAPTIPMLFMGQEFHALSPFLFFCDFHGALSNRIGRGRRRMYKEFPEFSKTDFMKNSPKPNDMNTFELSRLDWRRSEENEGARWLAFYRKLTEVRRVEIAPRIKGIRSGAADYSADDGLLNVRWRLGGGSHLSMTANLSDSDAATNEIHQGRLIYETAEGIAEYVEDGAIPPWSAVWKILENQ